MQELGPGGRERLGRLRCRGGEPRTNSRRSEIGRAGWTTGGSDGHRDRTGAVVSLRRRGGNLLAPVRPLLSKGAGMTPGFLVIGTKRGGSTSAYHWIAQHPEVAPCRTEKGTHYFD